jgi:hypothetical protein
MSECDAECPFSRIDRMGLIWLLNGDRLLALTVDSARRTPAASGRCRIGRPRR